MRGEPDTRRAGAREQELQLRQGISATGRVQLKELMKEGLGDHVLYLRLFQARPSSSGQRLSTRVSTGSHADAMHHVSAVSQQVVLGSTARAKDQGRRGGTGNVMNNHV